MPQELEEVIQTPEGITLAQQRSRDTILNFLRAHPGQYFSVHDFSKWGRPDRMPFENRDDPFWWLSGWRAKAPEGFEGLSHRDPRLVYTNHTTVVGFVGTPGFTRIGATREQVLARQAEEIKQTDGVLAEVYAFLDAHRGVVYTADEIADGLAHEPKRLFRSRKKVLSPAGFGNLTIRSTIQEFAEHHRGDDSIYRDIVSQFVDNAVDGHQTARVYGLRRLA